MPPQLILASGSEARAVLLREAGVRFEVVTGGVDETAVKAGMQSEGALPRDIADTLAEMKARRVAARMPDRLVLGADQILVSAGVMFDKPHNLQGAREQLIALRGKPHDILSAAVICEAGVPVWRHIGRAELTMRAFSDAFLENYLALHGSALLETVGAYRLEAGGSQLFSRVRGDYFSVLGLPLLELLAFLRTRGVCLE